ncbi:MAG: hypothetical protein Unbinned3459contig1000_23 [Prokaryotic dsDNA virus sp.]|jgi:hypothetical protein|nr:MAG: hypothetical protein Unbinned3459contig1000_23 [Prokaryotic dsDNA virus sp.]|tara:strand:+ start:29376 stop:31739 length:2364 start_codon:yes stop_codon:yes gene_type:complete
MALSPADFAAYSRATGTSYPESPEERAQLVPEVRAFRQRQLQPPEKQESNSLALGLGIGLGLAGVGGGLMTLRGRAKKGIKADTAGKSSVKMTDLSDQQVPKSKTQVYRDVAAKAEEDLPQVTRPSGGVDESMLVTDPETGEVYRRGGDASIRSKQAQENLSDRVDELLAEVSVGEAGQMLAGREVAAEAGQMMGTESSRQSNVVRRLEKEEERQAKNILSELAQETLSQADSEKAARIARNQAKDRAQVSDYMSDVLESVIDENYQYPEEVPSNLMGLARRAKQNKLTDSDFSSIQQWAQTEFKNDPTVLGEINENLSSLPKTSTLTETYEAFGEPAAQVQNIEALNTASDQAAAPIERAVQRNEDIDVSAAQSFLNQQRDKLQAKGLSPTRVERVLASNPELIEAAELYASTGDEAVLSRFSEQPASPVTVKPKSVLSLDSDELATGSLFKSGTFGEFVDDLEGKDVDLTNRISSLGAEQQQLAGRRKQLEEDSLMIKSAMDREPIDKDDYSRMYGQMQYEMQNMPDPASLNVDIGDAMAERDHVRAQLKGLKEVGAQQFLIDQTEGSRAFYEVNPATNEIIPETLEVRGGRKSIEQKKGGGGRNIAEYSAGDRIAEEVRSIQQGGRLRDYDDTGAAKQVFEGDRTQTGGRLGLYGSERTERKGERATAGQRPTQVTEDELINQALMDSRADELGIPTPPDRDLVFVDEQKYQKPDRQNRLLDSEILRRTAIEGRNPQSSLAGRAQRQSRPRIAALRQEATRRKAAGEPLMSKAEAFNFLSNYAK